MEPAEYFRFCNLFLDKLTYNTNFATANTPMTEKETKLLDRICKKDQGSFESLYKTYYSKLYVLAFKYVRNQEIAEELVNDVFLKIWVDAARLNITQSLGLYLSRCIVNAALNNLNKEKKTAGKQEKYLQEFDEIDDADDEAQILEEQLLKLEKAIEHLPPQCKKVMMMSKFDKYKQHEIADALNISIKTVKNHLTQGYEKIRGLLSKELIIMAILFFNRLFN